MFDTGMGVLVAAGVGAAAQIAAARQMARDEFIAYAYVPGLPPPQILRAAQPARCASCGSGQTERHRTLGHQVCAHCGCTAGLR